MNVSMFYINLKIIRKSMFYMYEVDGSAFMYEEDKSTLKSKDLVQAPEA